MAGYRTCKLHMWIRARIIKHTWPVLVYAVQARMVHKQLNEKSKGGQGQRGPATVCVYIHKLRSKCSKAVCRPEQGAGW